ncbi:MAG: outer membrane protein assembly factor BamD [Bacteroidales bacterium]|nr:outer membrane protein assembly factor BamD [Bacteroidales bacterium]
MIKKSIVFLLVVLFSAGGVQGYAQSKKGDTTPRKYRKYKTKEAKFEAAKTFYHKGMYLSAAELFEQVYPLFMGTVQGDSILFLFADSYYKNGDYLMAAFHFNDFTKKYPFSPRAEEAAFLAAKAHFLNVPAYNLDQTDAFLAKDGLESFMENYPQSRFGSECNAMLDSIRNQLAHKAYATAYMYYNIGKYASAHIAFNNLLKDYPGSPYTEKALFYMVKNSFEYAENSVPARQAERYQQAADCYRRLESGFPDSPHLSEAKKIAEEAVRKREKILQ